VRRRLGVMLAIVAIVASACGSSKKSSTTATTASTKGPQTFRVDVDHKNPDTEVAETFTAYFPNSLTVHPGDTVHFKLQDTGEPHTVTLGSLVDNVLTMAAKAPQNSAGPPPALVQAADKKLPLLFPLGPGDAIQAAAVPCFLATGDAPTKDACPAAEQSPTDFTGTQTYYNSGWLLAGKDFVVKLAKDIKPGKYQYMCLLHREGMTGSITVVPLATTRPSPAAQLAVGKQEVAKIKAQLQPGVDGLAKGTNPDLGPLLPPGSTLAGSGIKDVQNAQIDGFGPKLVSIPVGGSVTWIVVGDHTIAFNAPEDAKSIRVPGTTHLNAKAAGPAGGPGAPPPREGNLNGPPPPPRITNAGSWDGTGFHSSGLFLSFPPALDGYKLTFTKAGTYQYKCLIHDNMEGTIKVG
jgi:plastocyanin